MIGADNVVPSAGLIGEYPAPFDEPNVIDRRDFETAERLRRSVRRGHRLNDDAFETYQKAAAFQRLVRTRVRGDGVDDRCPNVGIPLRRQPR